MSGAEDLVRPPWWPHDREKNVQFLRERYPEALKALEYLDRLGYRILKRFESEGTVTADEDLVAMAMARRLTTHFAGVRILLVAAAVEQAKLGARSLFELYLFVKYLVHGPPGASSSSERETRARRFVAFDRLELLQRIQVAMDGKIPSMQLTNEDRAGLGVIVKTMRASLARDLGPDLDLLLPQGWGTRPQPWYAFGFSKGKNPESLPQLAAALSESDDYRVVAQSFALLVHAAGVDRDVDLTEGAMSLYSPYLIESFDLVCERACYWHGSALEMLTEAYQPGSISDVRGERDRIRSLLEKLEPRLPRGFL